MYWKVLTVGFTTRRILDVRFDKKFLMHQILLNNIISERYNSLPSEGCSMINSVIMGVCII